MDILALLADVNSTCIHCICDNSWNNVHTFHLGVKCDLARKKTDTFIALTVDNPNHNIHPHLQLCWLKMPDKTPRHGQNDLTLGFNCQESMFC